MGKEEREERRGRTYAAASEEEEADPLDDGELALQKEDGEEGRCEDLQLRQNLDSTHQNDVAQRVSTAQGVASTGHGVAGT